MSASVSTRSAAKLEDQLSAPEVPLSAAMSVDERDRLRRLFTQFLETLDTSK